MLLQFYDWINQIFEVANLSSSRIGLSMLTPKLQYKRPGSIPNTICQFSPATSISSNNITVVIVDQLAHPSFLHLACKHITYTFIINEIRMGRKNCVLCRTVPCDILTLECQHTLCVPCANRVRSAKVSLIGCPICRHQTYLDDDIIGYLQQKDQEDAHSNSRALPQDHASEVMDNQFRPNLTANSYGTIESYQKGNLGVRKENSMKKRKEKKSRHSLQTIMKAEDCPSLGCEKHPEYEMMYVCLSCSYELICPQCVIHGCHRNHEVQSIRKMVLTIHSQLSSKIYSMNCSIEGLVRASDQKKMKLKKQIENINKLKEDAIQKYKRIRAQLTKEESEIIEKCNNLVKCFSQDYQEAKSWIEEDLLTIEKEKNLISRILNPPLSEAHGQKITEFKIASEYIQYVEVKKKGKDTKYMWINQPSDPASENQQESQRSLAILTDRIKKISLQEHCRQLNQMETKPSSLMGSKRVSNFTKGSLTDIQQTATRKQESPFNLLKSSEGKENIVPETESMLVKASRLKGSRRSAKNVKTQQQLNFLIF